MERIVFAQLSSIIEMNLLTRMMSMFASQRLKVGSVTRTGIGQYSGTPAVSFTGGGGTGAAATANMVLTNVAGAVTGISGSMGGYYSLSSATPTVTFSGGGGSGAAATAVFSTGYVISVQGQARTTSGSGSFIFSGGGGSGAAASYDSTGFPPGVGAARFIYSAVYAMSNYGTGYTSAPTISFVDQNGGQSITFPTATASISGGQVTGITHVTNGEMICVNNEFGPPTSRPAVVISGGGGTGAAAFIQSISIQTVIDYWVPSLALSSGTIATSNLGSGYTSAPSVSVPGLVAGTNSLVARTGRTISSFTITSGGSYTSNPTVTVSGGTQESGYSVSHSWTAYGNWFSYYYVNTITVTNSGSGYTSAPTVVFSGGGFTTHATATANMIPE
jgi:hypothetical protein